MKIAEHQSKQVVIWYNLNPEEFQFWTAVVIEKIKEGRGVADSFTYADIATLELIKRRS